MNYTNPIELFNEFYRHIVGIKRQINTGTLSQHVAEALHLNTNPTDREIAQQVSLQLQHWIEQVRKTAKQLLTAREYLFLEQSLFVFTALADELFIILIDWPGKAHWHEVLLEEAIFDSSFAGEKFFLLVDELLQQRSLDNQQSQMAATMLLTLKLGFCGRYRGQSKRLSFIRQELYKRINVDPLNSAMADTPITDTSTKICSQAYQHLLSSQQEQRLAPLAGWYKVMAWGVLAYLATGMIIWQSLSGSWS